VLKKGADKLFAGLKKNVLLSDLVKAQTGGGYVRAYENSEDVSFCRAIGLAIADEGGVRGLIVTTVRGDPSGIPGKRDLENLAIFVAGNGPVIELLPVREDTFYLSSDGTMSSNSKNLR